MKATVVAAAALLGGASAAHNHQQRHAHEAFHLKRGNNDTDADQVCTEIVKTITGDNYIWVPTPNAPPAVPNVTSTLTSTDAVTTQLTQVVTSTAPVTAAPVPTPAAQTCETPGVYTFPATTLTINETTTALVPSSTACTPGVYTLGGVVTVVETATTVVCPYATVKTNSGVVTSVIESTTYVCPAAGTYTIAPTTTTVTANETVTIPSITTIEPGVYTAPAVTTVVETATVIYCPFESVTDTPATSAPATSAAPVPSSAAPAPTTTSAAEPEEPTTTAEPVVPVASSSAAVVPSSVAPSSSSAAPLATASSSSVVLGGNGKSPWSLTYTPYNAETGECQTADAVAVEVAAIAAAGFTSLRVYSTDCDTLPNVGAAAAKHGLKMIVGIYIGNAGCTNASPDVEDQIAQFRDWAQWDLVELFSVANEAINNGYCTAAEIAALITHVKSELPGYTGPYTTTDVVGVWQQDGVAEALCPVVDHPSANAHSYFTSTVSPEDAGEFVKGQLEIVEAACGGEKTAYILESGYPTAGSTIGLNVPSAANQAIAIASILDVIGDRVVLFSMFDDKWKDPGAYGCEQSWGIAPSLFGTVGEAWAALAAAL